MQSTSNSSNSESFASELLEILKKMFHHYMHSDMLQSHNSVFSVAKELTPHHKQFS